jgi:hypothetical protein
MKKHSITKLVLCALLAGSSGALLGCNPDVHDNTLDVHDNTANISDAKVQFDTDVDVDQVMASDSVHVNVSAENVFLIDPDEDPPSDRVKVAGHFEFFLDSTSSAPLLVTASESVDVPIPADATPGDHKLICQIFKHDGTPTTATFELAIKISGSVTSGSAGSGTTGSETAGSGGSTTTGTAGSASGGHY